MLPITAIHPNDPERKHHRLTKKLTRRSQVDEAEGGTGATTCIEDTKKLDSLNAIEIDNKLASDDPEANSLQQIAEPIAALHPTDKQNVIIPRKANTSGAIARWCCKKTGGDQRQTLQLPPLLQWRQLLQLVQARQIPEGLQMAALGMAQHVADFT